MKINLWRVASYATFLVTATGLAIALILDGDAIGWTTASLAALTWTRIEWVLSAIIDSKKGDEDED